MSAEIPSFSESSTGHAFVKSHLNARATIRLLGHYWPFEETGSPSHFADVVSGNSLFNDVGAPTTPDGIIGRAPLLPSFNGGGTGIFMVAPAALGSAGFTAFGWTKFVASGANLVTEIHIGDGVTNVVVIRIQDQFLSGTLKLVVNGEIIDITTPPPDWFFWSITYARVTGFVTAEINTASATTTTVPHIVPSAGHTVDLGLESVALVTNPSGQYCDETGLMLRPATPTELAFAYNGGAGRTWPSLKTLFIRT